MSESIEVLRAERRAKREARREKQREESVHRAAKMHRARIEYEREHRDGAVTNSDLPAINVGCSGWFYWHWRENFYPSKCRTCDWFDFYATKFRTVELNAPFYSWPTLGTVESWNRQIGRRRFVYTIKVNELITHRKRMVGAKTLVRDFGLIADLLGPRFGCFLFQFPPSVHYSKSMLNRVLGALDPKRRNVVEFRHASWWNDTVFEAFRKTNTIFCSCSGPRLPDQLVRTADDIYIRFHGTKRWYRHDYTKEELAVWVRRVKESGAKRVWAYFNNDRDCYSIKNAREFLRQLRRDA